MKKIVWIFGSIAGLICGAMFFLNHPGDDPEALVERMKYGELIGYTTMILSLSSIFFAVKQYRDQHLGGTISFGKAFLMGLYITLIATGIYVISWEIYYHLFASNFTDVYLQYQQAQWAESGMSAADIEARLAEQRPMMESYRTNRPFRMALTSMEILPVGLIISLICGLILGVFLKKTPAESVSQ